MNVSLHYFLTVAEELSISRAAERLFVSQQCISSHIKKLEQTYQAELFVRRPVFHLTPEGEALRRSLLRQRVLESALAEELGELKERRLNRIRIGIHNTRANLLLPDVIPEFQQAFPDVLIEIYQGYTSNFEIMLLDGKLDLFLATDIAERPEFRCAFLQKERILLVSTVNFLKSYGMDSIIASHKASASQLLEFPFICNPADSYLQTKIDGWLAKKKIMIQKKIIVGTNQIQLMLAAQNVGACFCPQMFLQMIHGLNQTVSADNPLIAISVEDFDLSTELSIITHRDAYQSAVLRKFSDIFKQVISSSINMSELP